MGEEVRSIVGIAPRVEGVRSVGESGGLLAIGAVAAIFFDRPSELAGLGDFPGAVEFADNVLLGRSFFLGVGHRVGEGNRRIEFSDTGVGHRKESGDAGLAPVGGEGLGGLGIEGELFRLLAAQIGQVGGEFEQHHGLAARRQLGRSGARSGAVAASGEKGRHVVEQFFP